MQSVILGNGPALAVLNGQSYRVGQRIDGFLLVGISADAVVLEKAGKRQTLTCLAARSGCEVGSARDAAGQVCRVSLRVRCTNNMKKHHFCLLPLALAVAACTSYQHPEPVQAKDALKQAMKEQTPTAPLTTLPPSVQSELLQLNRPQQPLAVPEKRLRIAAHDVDAVEFFGSLFKGSRYSVAVHPGWPVPSRWN